MVLLTRDLEQLQQQFPNDQMERVNGEIRVCSEQLRPSPRSFPAVIPALMVDMKSPSEPLPKCRNKIQDFQTLGSRDGRLMNPEQCQVYRPNPDPLIIANGDDFPVSELLAGWCVAMTESMGTPI